MLIKEEKRLWSNLRIGFGFTWEEINFQIKENLSSKNPFRLPKRINNNANQLDILKEYGVSRDFNVYDFSPCDVGLLNLQAHSLLDRIKDVNKGVE